MPFRILVVEASDDMRTLIAGVLTADRHAVRCVANGAEALALLDRRSAFDLILSDLTLPAIEGAQLYWEIGARWPQLASRLICLTDGHDAAWIDHDTPRGFGADPDQALPALDAAGDGQAGARTWLTPSCRAASASGYVSAPEPRTAPSASPLATSRPLPR
jgi:CheY-like chemotaxis protein